NDVVITRHAQTERAREATKPGIKIDVTIARWRLASSMGACSRGSPPALRGQGELRAHPNDTPADARGRLDSGRHRADVRFRGHDVVVPLVRHACGVAPGMKGQVESI